MTGAFQPDFMERYKTQSISRGVEDETVSPNRNEWRNHMETNERNRLVTYQNQRRIQERVGVWVGS